MDLAILLEPVSTEKYETIVLPRKEKWGLLVSTDSFLAQKEELTKDELQGVPLLISKRSEVQELLSRFMEKDVTDLTIIGTFNLIFNIFSLVENNVGSAFVIEGAITGREVDTLKFLPLSPTIETNCVLVWKKKRSLSPVVKELIHRFSTAFLN